MVIIITEDVQIITTKINNFVSDVTYVCV